MKKYRPRTKHSSLGSQFKYNNDGDFPISQFVIKYAMNLLGYHSISAKFLSFIILVLSMKSRSEFVEYIIKRHKDVEHLDRNYMNIQDPVRLADAIIDDFYENELSLSEGDIEKYLLCLIKNENEFYNSNKKASLTTEVKNIRDIFELSDDEVKILIFYYCYEQFESLRDLGDFYSLTADI